MKSPNTHEDDTGYRGQNPVAKYDEEPSLTEADSPAQNLMGQPEHKVASDRGSLLRIDLDVATMAI